MGYPSRAAAVGDLSTSSQFVSPLSLRDFSSYPQIGQGPVKLVPAAVRLQTYPRLSFAAGTAPLFRPVIPVILALMRFALP
jgi:hypothetical protein